MMTDFSKYTLAVFRAFEAAGAAQEIIDKKADIINQVCRTQNLVPTSILFVGFNPAIYAIKNCTVAITNVDATVAKEIKKKMPSVQIVDDWAQHAKKFDCVVAFEEYFTYAATDQEQYNRVLALTDLTKHCLITTLKDYKNLEYKDREFSIPAVIKADPDHTLFFEYHSQDYDNRGSWKTMVYQICNTTLTCYGPFVRRNMFFKQLAKFSGDAGCTQFTVHKNLMHKSLIKKNYEHVISMTF